MPISIRPTPNPNSLMFSTSGPPFLAQGMLAFASAAEAAGNALGEALFALEGVINVFVVPDFVTVTKRPEADWEAILPAAERILADHLAGGS